MKSLALLLMTWIGLVTGYDVDYPVPPIFIVSEDMLSEIWGSKVFACGIYTSGIIYLHEGCSNMDNLHYRSILVHELFHHVQVMNKIPYKCRARREAHAYAVQFNWIKTTGIKYNKSWYEERINKKC